MPDRTTDPADMSEVTAPVGRVNLPRPGGADASRENQLMKVMLGLIMVGLALVGLVIIMSGAFRLTPS